MEELKGDFNTMEEIISDQPPNLLMELDDEVEHCIVLPILYDVIEQVSEECRLRNLEKIVEMNMEEVTRETERETNESMVENILLGVISDAVKEAKKPNSKLFEYFLKRRSIINWCLNLRKLLAFNDTLEKRIDRLSMNVRSIPILYAAKR